MTLLRTATAVAPGFNRKRPTVTGGDSLELKFSYREGNRTCYGSGRTRDFDERLLYFESDHHIPRGAGLQITIPCPPALAGHRAANLLMTGKLEGFSGNIATIRIQGFEFQTCSEFSLSGQTNCGDIVSVLA
jgi:hypothetical protein